MTYEEEEVQDLWDELTDRLYTFYQADKYEEALECSYEILREYPNDTYTLFYQARSYLMLKRYDEAEATIQQHLSVKPDSMDGLNLMGDLCYYQAKYEEAIVYYEQCIAKDPEDPVYWMDLAWAFYNSVDHDDIYENRINSYKIRPEQARRINQAIDALNQANLLRPGHTDQIRLLGQCYELLFKTELALENYQKVVVLNPSYYYIHSLLAQYWMNQGNMRTAASHCDQALMLNPNCSKGLWVKESLDEFKQDPLQYYQHTKKFHTTCCRLYPDNADYLLKLINIKLEYGKQPIKELKIYLKLRPDDWEMQLMYGKVLYDSKRYWSAIRHFRKLKQTNPDDPFVNTWLDKLLRLSKARIYVFPSLKRAGLYLLVYPIFIVLLPLYFLYKFITGSRK